MKILLLLIISFGCLMLFLSAATSYKNTPTFSSSPSFPSLPSSSSSTVVATVPPATAYAYATFLCSDSDLGYVESAKKLIIQLQKLDHQTPVIILVLKGLSPKYEQEFVELGAKVKFVEPIEGPTGKAFAIAHYRHVYAKLHLWELVEYTYVVYIDADCFVVKNPHSIFDLCDNAKLCAVKDTYIHRNNLNRGLDRYFNVGVMGFRPSMTEYSFLLKQVATLKENPTFPEQDVLNDFYDKGWKELPHEYNAINDNRLQLESLYIVHLTWKVWRQRGTAAYNFWKNIQPRFSLRDDFPYELEKAGFKTGAELGVQNGLYSEQLLKHWPSCERLYLIDVWKQQENYFDGANVPQHLQDRAYANTMQKVAPFGNKTVVILRMFTTEAVKHIPDDSLDFVYVDARHDYCGVMEDLQNYYPKLKVGGYMAGHDYKTAAEVRLINKGEDWSVCSNGTRNEGSVKGAVDEFIKQKGVTKLYVTKELWASWLFIKIYA